MREALSGKDANFNLCHIQPGGVNGSVVNFQPLYDPSGLSRFKSFIQGRNRVNVQIVHDQHNFFTMAVMDIHQFMQKMGKIYCSSGVCKFHNPFAGQRFKGNKQIHHATAAVLVIFPFHTSWFCWDALFLNQLLVCFIQADYRAQRVVRLLVYIQNILHPRYKFRPRLGDTPFLLLPRLKFVFFSVSITAVSEILSTTPSRTSSSAISCSVHRSPPPALLNRQWL